MGISLFMSMNYTVSLPPSQSNHAQYPFCLESIYISPFTHCGSVTQSDWEQHIQHSLKGSDLFQERPFILVQENARLHPASISMARKKRITVDGPMCFISISELSPLENTSGFFKPEVCKRFVAWNFHQTGIEGTPPTESLPAITPNVVRLLLHDSKMLFISKHSISEFAKCVDQN